MKKLILLIIMIFPIASFSQVSALQTVRQVYDLLEKYDVNSRNAPRQKEKIDEYWLLDDIALDAIKGHWEFMTKDQQNRYMILMRQLLEKTIYEDTGDKLQKGISNIYKQESLSQSKAIVRSRLTVKKNNITVSNDYGLIRNSQNLWKIRDIYIDGQNLAEDYNSQYNQIISKYGIDGNSNALLERIEKSIQKDSDWYNFNDEEGSPSQEKIEDTPTKPKRTRPSLLS